MSIFSNKQKADYTETLHKGISFVRSLRGGLTDDTGSREENLQRLKDEIKNSDAIVIGAGAGLSTAAGYTYSGERFERWFFDFKERLGLTDMYSGGFYPFPDDETRWAFWARNIYVNRYLAPPKPVYDDLLALVRGRNYFVITTNVDHCFQRAGFEKERLFYTQGDYGLFQSADGRIKETYDNEAWVRKAMAAQRFLPDESGAFRVPKDRLVSMRIPRELIPTLPNGGPVTMNLRVDDSFVEALIELKVTPKKETGFDEIAEMCMAFDEVESVYLMAGVYDLALIVRGQTMQDIAMFVAKKLSTIEGVLSTGTHFIMRRYKDRGLNLTEFGGDKDERSLIL